MLKYLYEIIRMKTNYIQYMTDQVNSAGDNIRYKSPQVKVVEVKAQRVLCGSLDGSPSNNPWSSGSDSTGSFGDDE